MISQHAFVSHLSVLLFGLSSWLLVNAVWVELALLVQSAPEGYALASHMAIALQAANIFPLVYSIMARWKDPPAPYQASVALILLMGIASCELLAQYWNHTAVVFGEPRSAVLILLLFVGGALDCTSSVVYWPFVSTFDEPYTASLATGESLSGSLPALLAAWQIPLSGAPLFGVSAFFHVMTTLMVLSSAAFATLHLPPFRPHPAAARTPALLHPGDDSTEALPEVGGESLAGGAGEEAGGKPGGGCDVTASSESLASLELECAALRARGGSRGAGAGGSRDGMESDEEEDAARAGWGDEEEWAELWRLCKGPVLWEGWLKLVVDGVYPSLFPFACKGFADPYRVLFVGGIVVSLVKPLGAHVATYPFLRCRRISLLTAVWTLQFAVIIALAFLSSGHALSPHGWLLVALAGSGGCWAGYTHAMLFVELGLTCSEARLPPAARTACYRWAGQSTQAGALAGTIVAFVLVNFSGLFSF